MSGDHESLQHTNVSKDSWKIIHSWSTVLHKK